MKADAFADNPVQAYTGLRGNALNATQKKHLSDTYVTWAGGTADNSAFSVRVHSPVVRVEVDCGQELLRQHHLTSPHHH